MDEHTAVVSGGGVGCVRRFNVINIFNSNTWQTEHCLLTNVLRSGSSTRLGLKPIQVSSSSEGDSVWLFPRPGASSSISGPGGIQQSACWVKFWTWVLLSTHSVFCFF